MVDGLVVVMVESWAVCWALRKVDGRVDHWAEWKVVNWVVVMVEP